MESTNMNARLATIAVLLLGAAVFQAAAQNWRTGRTTYYGAPRKFAEAYDPSRGEGSFGVLAGGSCGFTNQPGNSLPFPPDSVGAAASNNPDYAGSCGRCYAVRCKSGLVQNNAGQAISISGGTYDGDRWRPYLPAINANVTDSQNRPFPGNPAEAQGQEFVTCYDEQKTLIIRIVDSCPCTQVLPAGAPGVAPGGETRTQEWCCGGVPHFDLSYGAFEQLAHPLYGVMMLEYAPVDCDSGAPLPDSYISRDTIYSGGTKPGWGWSTFSASSQTYAVNAGAPSGNAATCVTLAPGGGLSFTCKGCDASGLQPFGGASGISFWIKSNANADRYFSSAPQGQVPNLKTLILNDATKRYCSAEPTTGSLTASQRSGDWYRFDIPISAYNCDSTSDKTRFELQNINSLNTLFCIADLQIQRGGGGSSVASTAG